MGGDGGDVGASGMSLEEAKAVLERAGLSKKDSRRSEGSQEKERQEVQEGEEGQQKEGKETEACFTARAPTAAMIATAQTTAAVEERRESGKASAKQER